MHFIFILIINKVRGSCYISHINKGTHKPSIGEITVSTDTINVQYSVPTETVLLPTAVCLNLNFLKSRRHQIEKS